MVVPSASRGQNSGDGVRFRASHLVDDGFVRGTDAPICDSPGLGRFFAPYGVPRSAGHAAPPAAGIHATTPRDDADFLATAEAVQAGWQPALAGIEEAAPPAAVQAAPR